MNGGSPMLSNRLMSFFNQFVNEICADESAPKSTSKLTSRLTSQLTSKTVSQSAAQTADTERHSLKALLDKTVLNKTVPEETRLEPEMAEESVGETVASIVRNMFVGLAVGGAAIYALVLRPKMLSWGATVDEKTLPLPGDELVPEPRHVWTRALTIQAPRAAVWPWLVQMGQGRGGLYSYDRLENLIGCDIHSVDHIVPELQDLGVGDEIRLVRPDYPVDLALTVARLESETALVLRAKDDMATALAAGLPYISWAFVLRAIPEGATRLIVRTRATYVPTFSSLFWNRYFLEPIQFIMERKMMLGIQERAERVVEAHRFDAHSIETG